MRLRFNETIYSWRDPLAKYAPSPQACANKKGRRISPTAPLFWLRKKL
jgi:hypothetical protein